jgi:hypothetical protein
LVLLVITESNDVIDDLRFSHDPYGHSVDTLRGLWARSTLLRFLYLRSEGLRRWSQMVRRENVQRTLRYIDEIASTCHQDEIPLVVATFPSKAQMISSGLTFRILRWLRVEERLHGRIVQHLRLHPQVSAAVDLTEVLSSSGNDGLYYPMDGHPTPQAYEVCARSLAQQIGLLLDR